MRLNVWRMYAFSRSQARGIWRKMGQVRATTPAYRERVAEAPETRRNPLQRRSEYSRTIQCDDKRFIRDLLAPCVRFQRTA